MNDSTKILINDTEHNIDILLKSKLADLSSKSTEYIQEVESLKKSAKERYKRFYGRKKWIDYLIIANLTLTPLILVFMTYWVFLKK